MVKVGEQGIYLSDETVKKLSPYMLSQFKKTLVLDFSALNTTAPIYTETDPVFSAWLATPPNISIFTNDSGYLTSFTETDPIFSLWQSTYDNHTDWDTAYGWGNHASAGYTPQTRNITINGITQDLSSDRSWTVTAGLTQAQVLGMKEFI